jgi:hypothetical protein
MGLVSGVAALSFSFLLKILFNGVFLPELASQTLFSLVPGRISSVLIRELGYLAKYLTLAGAITVNLALYGLLGLFLSGYYEMVSRKRYMAQILLFSIIPYTAFLIIGAILLSLTEIVAQHISLQLIALHLIPPHLVYGLLLGTFFRSGYRYEARMAPMPGKLASRPPVDRRRRLFIRVAISSVAASIILYFSLDLIFGRLAEMSRPRLDPRFSSLVDHEVTPSDLFFKVGVSVGDPRVNEGLWRLGVKGLVDNPLELSIDELKSMPTVEQYATLECVGNTIGGASISNALWRGVPLKRILEMAGVPPEAKYVVFRCYDGYDVAIPLERGVQEGTLLAYEMNGFPIPEGHGRPLRAIVPGLYGMMNPKWITEIEVIDYEYKGLWQRSGWSNKAEYETHSTILIPGYSPLRKRFGRLDASNIVEGEKTIVAGVAFTGDRGISKVEVSTDGGKSWTPASIKDPLSDYTWVLWATEWTPPAKGEYRLMVKATDKEGKVQTAEIRSGFPEGATGYHVIDIDVVEPG